MSPRWTHVTTAALLVMHGALAGAQGATPTTASELALQFAVPSSPAFKLVQVSESSILRPTSFQQFASTIGDLGSFQGGLALPREVGVEVAPFFIAHGRTLTLPAYAQHASLYRFRVSSAFRRGTGDGKPAMLSVGLRFAPRDASDPRTDRTLVSEVTEQDALIAAVCAGMATTAPTGESRVLKTCADPRAHEAELEKAIIAASDEKRPALERQLVDFRRANAAAQGAIDAANARLRKLKAGWTESAWNKSGYEYAFAAAGQSADTLGRQPEFRSAAAWFSGAMQLRTWGQLVAGANFTTGRDSIDTTIRQTYAAGLGLFVGSNWYKGFAEAQASGKSAAKSAGAFANLGGEVYLGPGLWVVASAGWSLDPDNHQSSLVSHLSFRTKFPLKTPERSSADNPDAAR